MAGYTGKHDGGLPRMPTLLRDVGMAHGTWRSQYSWPPQDVLVLQPE
jgi:hypothetical protein